MFRMRLSIEQKRIITIIATKWKGEINQLLQKNQDCDAIGFSRRISFKNRFDINAYIKNVMYSRQSKIFSTTLTLAYKSTQDKNISDHTELKFANKSIHKLIQTIMLKIDSFLVCEECDSMTSNYNNEEKKCEECLFSTIAHEFNSCEEYCSICMTDTKNYTKLKCGHKFHSNCVKRLDKCPMCRADIQTNNAPTRIFILASGNESE